MEIHPRRVGESLSDVVHVLRGVWRPLILPALISSVAVATASYLILRETGALNLIDLAGNRPDVLPELPQEELRDLLIDFVRGFLWVAIASGGIYGFLHLAAARAVAEEVASARAPSSVMAGAARVYLPWLVAVALIYAGVAVGLALLIVPGIWLAVSLVLTTPVMAIEEVGPVAALRRSRALVRGNWWETLGFLLLVGLVGGTATQFIQLFAVPVFLVGSPSLAFGIAVAMGLAVQGLIMAGIAVAIAVWYLNLRARTDGPFVLSLG